MCEIDVLKGTLEFFCLLKSMAPHLQCLPGDMVFSASSLDDI